MNNKYLERQIPTGVNEKNEKVFKKLGDIIGENGLWMTGKMPILSYSSCKKLFTEANLRHVTEPKLLCQPNESNKQQHIWIMGLEDKFGNIVYADGEASKYNTGKIVNVVKDGKPVAVYSETSEIDAKYRSRMAFKRAFCRCVMDILGLEEFYSETDATEFKKQKEKVESGTDAELIESL